MANNLRTIFVGTPEFSAIVLDKMIKANLAPIAVITSPDKPVGRHAYRQANKQILTPSPVKVMAEKNKISVLQSEKISDLRLKIKDFKPDLIILAAFGQIISKEILAIPKYGCLNIHPSLLPKYRGASPIQSSILNGDNETGVTIMIMDEKLDSGPILANDKWQMTNNETTEKLTKKLAELGAELLIKIIPKWINKEITAQMQDDSKASFTKEIKKENGQIDWHKSADEIERMTRAYNPWPGVYTEFRIKNKEYKRLKIIKARVSLTEKKYEPGTVFLIHSTGSVLIPRKIEGLTEKKELAVACKQDALILEEVQLEGKKIMNSQTFLNGYSWIVDSVLK
jgi:methionyl-tRNA formyltransferase